MFDNDSKNRSKLERCRGWILKFLYSERPAPMELALLQECMDTVNFPMTFRQLAQELDFLRTEKMLRVFPFGATTELDEVAQARLLQRCCEIEEEARKVCIRIRTQGINFQEGNLQCLGVARVR